jgi:peptide/nickel transport system substrate-binding protein
MPDVTICAQTEGESLRPEFDLDAARATLEASGWRRDSSGIYEKDGEPLTIRVGSHNQEGSAGEYLSQALKDLGADVSSHQVELAAYVEDLMEGEWDVYASTVNRLDSPATLAVPFSRYGLDAAHIRNEPFEDAMTAARNAPSFDDSCELWKSAQDELVRNVDVVPQAHLNLIYFDAGVNFSLGFFGLIEPTSLARE